MTTAELYHYFANDCLRGAERADNPKQRALLLKLAAEWLIAAQQILRSILDHARVAQRRREIGQAPSGQT
jgi:hypothetical protein